mmetsp:Transcript_44509/g.141814  ORF Transcript_44509/g.141814 Transcript_44509/m.141814 type:complete len:235 (+) Transcript_44509:45-749(+)
MMSRPPGSASGLHRRLLELHLQLQLPERRGFPDRLPGLWGIVRAQQRHCHRLPWFVLVELGEDVVDAPDAAVVDLRQDVPRADAGLAPGAQALQPRDDASLAAGKPLREAVLAEVEAKAGPLDVAVLQDARDPRGDRVARDGEADARGGAAGRDDHGVHAHNLALAVEQRPAAVPGVDGGVRLDDAVDGPAASALHLPGDAADDPPAEAVLQAEGVAESEDALTHEKVRGGASW